MPEAIGDLAAGLLLEEVGPVIYNEAIADAQTRLQQRVADLPGELFEDESKIGHERPQSKNADDRSHRVKTAIASLQGQRPDLYQPRPKA